VHHKQSVLIYQRINTMPMKNVSLLTASNLMNGKMIANCKSERWERVHNLLQSIILAFKLKD